MLYIEELYNFFETEHNETLDYIDDMYIFLHIHSLTFHFYLKTYIDRPNIFY